MKNDYFHNNAEYSFDDYYEDIDSFDLGEPIDNEQGVSRLPALDLRDIQYTEAIAIYNKLYEKKTKSNITLRKCYFWCSFVLLFLLIGAMTAISIVLCFKVENVITIGAGMVSTIAALVVSCLVLPRIIGEYLFPKNEDRYMRDIMYRMREADEHRRDQELLEDKKNKHNDNIEG